MGHLRRVCLLSSMALGGLGCGRLTSIVPLSGAPPCSELDLEAPVYVTGSDSIVPILEALGPELSGTLQIVYSPQRSCAGPRTVLGGEDIEGEATVWSSEEAPSSCYLEPGTKADIGVSDVFVATCPKGEDWPDPVPAHVDVQGPIQSAFFTVPFDSDQESITRTQAQGVYGGAEPHEPWTDAKHIFRRPDESGTQNMIGAAIGVKSEDFRGTVKNSASEMIEAIDTTPPELANRTLGMFDVPTDAVRGNHKRLGYDGGDGSGPVWPSVEREGNAQENVRNGSYLLWGLLHMIVPADSNGVEIQTFTNHVATNFAGDGVLGLEEQKELLRKIIHARFVPACAMYVRRTADGVPPEPYAHEKPCHCFYESVVTGTTCTPCQVDGDCTGGMCNFGYCEP
jgi:hypothetical protein